MKSYLKNRYSKTYKFDINGKIVECKRFANRDTAQNYINKKEGRKLVHFQAHEYYVNK